MKKGNSAGQMELDFKGSGILRLSPKQGAKGSQPTNTVRGDQLSHQGKDTKVNILDIKDIKRERTRKILREQLVKTGIISEETDTRDTS